MAGKQPLKTLENFSTKRLGVQDWANTIADPSKKARLAMRLQTILTPAVLAPLPASMQLSPAHASLEAWIDAQAREATVFLVSERQSGAVIGLLFWVQITAPSGADVAHIGYLFAESAWGKGFASELVAGVVASFEGEGDVQIIGGVAKGNEASARVLRKSGFAHSAQLSDAETDQFVFSSGLQAR